MWRVAWRPRVHRAGLSSLELSDSNPVADNGLLQDSCEQGITACAMFAATDALCKIATTVSGHLCNSTYYKNAHQLLGFGQTLSPSNCNSEILAAIPPTDKHAHIGVNVVEQEACQLVGPDKMPRHHNST